VLLAAAGVAAVVFRPGPAGAPAPVEPAYPIPGQVEKLRVEVLNGTTRTGLARAATRQLREHGFDVVYFGQRTAVAKSLVVARQVDAAQVRAVAAALGIDSVSVQRDTMRRVDVSVWLGPDFRPAGPLHP
jgi:hypothetical protein